MLLRSNIRVKFLLILFVVAFLLFHYQPWIDLTVSSWWRFEGEWDGKRLPLVIVRNLYYWISWFLLFLAILMVFMSRYRQLQTSKRIYDFILAYFLIGPLLLVNGVLKSYWGRARPQDIIIFDGEKEFTPVSLLPVDQCDFDCSFVSGEGAAAFAFIFLIYALFGKWRLVTVIFLPMAFLRVMAGAHFLSDVVLAAIMMGLVFEILIPLFGLNYETLRSGRKIWADLKTVIGRRSDSPPEA